MNSFPRILRALFLVLPLTQLAGCWGMSSTSSSSATAPITALSVVAVAGNARVALTWNASPGATSYHVKRSTLSGGPYTQIAAPTTPYYTDVPLANGTTYFYVVSAMIGATESVNSAEVSATPSVTGGPTTLPPVPSGLVAAPGNSQVGLSWNAVSGPATYYVKRGTTSGGPYTVIADTTAVSYTDLGLVNGTTYFYVVSAFNGAGESANSAEVSAVPAGPLQIAGVPMGLVAAAGISQVSLIWVASNTATSYTVERSTVSGGPYTVIATTTSGAYVDTNVGNGTTYYYVVTAVNAAGASAISSEANATPVAPDVTVTINPAATQPISPYIYGINGYAGVTGAPPSLTLDRAGGDRWTTYNWETNASNAGSDYIYDNDNFLSSSATPAEAVRAIIAGDQGNGLATLVTFQMQGLVAGDESGPVSVSSPPDMTRFKTVVDVKGAPFTLTPPTTDAYVYMDEFAWALDQKFSGENIFGPAPATQRVFAELDNQPELWNTTHLEVQGSSPVTSDTYIQKTIVLAESLKNQFPNLVIFGPVHYGFGGIYNWQGELSATPTGNNWFPDKYLPALHTASIGYGKPLVDVYDFHWYSEATDGSGNRVINLPGPTLTDAQVEAIVQSPRSLWDTTYAENSWITSAFTLNGPIYILGRLQSRIATESPGMKIAISDYTNGGGQHISGTIAQADNLGIFGAQGLFAANASTANTNQPYVLAGFRAFRDFDGANSNFGDTSVQANSGNVQYIAAYASIDSTRPGRTVFVVINRSFSSQVVAITGQPLRGTAHLYQMTAASAATQATVEPVAAGTVAVTGDTLAVTLPGLSVTTIDVH